MYRTTSLGRPAGLRSAGLGWAERGEEQGLENEKPSPGSQVSQSLSRKGRVLSSEYEIAEVRNREGMHGCRQREARTEAILPTVEVRCQPPHVEGEKERGRGSHGWMG